MRFVGGLSRSYDLELVVEANQLDNGIRDTFVSASSRVRARLSRQINCLVCEFDRLATVQSGFDCTPLMLIDRYQSVTDTIVQLFDLPRFCCDCLSRAGSVGGVR